jgi:hypothetical protein
MGMFRPFLEPLLVRRSFGNHRIADDGEAASQGTGQHLDSTR